MNEGRHLESQHLTGAYALHALTPEEAEQVESAMAHSEDLRGEIAELTDTAVILGTALPPTAPPAALRARLLDAIQDLPQEPKAQPVPEQRLVATEHVVPRRPHRRVLRPSVLLSAGLAAVLLFGGGVLVHGAVTAGETTYASIVAAADKRSDQGAIAGGGTATVSWSRSEDGTVVELKGVDVPQGKVLQLWSVRGRSVTSEGLYTVSSDANYALLDGVPAEGERLAVTVEPSGGSAHPTTVPIVSVALS